MPEGELTKQGPAWYANRLWRFARGIWILGVTFCSEKAKRQQEARFRDSVTSDAMEALIGAVYLDGGFTNAKEFINRFVLTDLENKKLFYDSKTILQEMVPGREEGKCIYRLLKEKDLTIKNLSMYRC